MHLPKLLSFSVSSLLFVASAASAQEPPAPPLTFLYTAYVDCLPRVYTHTTPRGIRTTIPIVGGNFTGPRMSGKILDIGADWGINDPQTGIFSADTRYNLQTDDGANIFIQTSGPSQARGGLHLRIIFETGDKNYYWLNNIVAVGILNPVYRNESLSILRIDAWHMTTDRNVTTFSNGTIARRKA